MRLLLAALAITFAIAVTASVFAIWPVVGDALSENEAPAIVDDGTDAIRCQGGLGLLESATLAIVCLQ